MPSANPAIALLLQSKRPAGRAAGLIVSPPLGMPAEFFHGNKELLHSGDAGLIFNDLRNSFSEDVSSRFP